MGATRDKKPRVIITGGTGLIGQALSADLVPDGFEVVILSRNPATAPSMAPGVKVRRWDARTSEGWLDVVEGSLAIINLAGASLRRRWTKRGKELIRESRLNAGRAVVDAVTRATSRPEVVIQASGISCYGPRGDAIVTEETNLDNGFLGRTAAAWEASTAPVDALDVRRAIIRSGLVLSMSGGSFPLFVLPSRLFIGGPLGSGDQWLPWIHIRDQVRAIRFLLETDSAQGPFNAAAPNPVTNARFAHLLGRVLRRPSFFRVPGFVIRLMFGEMSTVVLDGQRALPRRLQKLGFQFEYPTLEPALRDLL